MDACRGACAAESSAESICRCCPSQKRYCTRSAGGKGNPSAASAAARSASEAPGLHGSPAHTSHHSVSLNRLGFGFIWSFDAEWRLVLLHILV